MLNVSSECALDAKAHCDTSGKGARDRSISFKMTCKRTKERNTREHKKVFMNTSAQYTGTCLHYFAELCQELTLCCVVVSSMSVYNIM